MVIIPSICKCAEIQHVRIRFGRWGDCVGVTRTLGGPARRLMDYHLMQWPMYSLLADAYWHAMVDVKSREMAVQYGLRKRVRNKCENG